MFHVEHAPNWRVFHNLIIIIMKKQGRLILVVGQKGTGKSTVVRSLVKDGENVYVNDMNLEFCQPVPKMEKDFPAWERYRDVSHLSDDEMLQFLSDKENSVIIYEEATVLFQSLSGKQNQLFARAAARTRHQGNTLIMNFLGFSFIPSKIIAFSDYIVLKKVNDPADLVKRKISGLQKEVLEAYERVSSSDDKYHTEVVCLNPSLQ